MTFGILTGNVETMHKVATIAISLVDISSPTVKLSGLVLAQLYMVTSHTANAHADLAMDC